ncbi:uncharacterized protein RBU33_003651 isoform 2-T4 [Hipposideros larvatus]
MVLPRLWHEMVLSLNPSSEAILTRVPMTTDWYREESLYQKVSTKKNIWRTTHQTVNSYALEESLSSACAKFSGLWWHPCHSNFPGSLYSRQMQSDITFACCSQNTNLCFQTELGSPNMG